VVLAAVVAAAAGCSTFEAKKPSSALLSPVGEQTAELASEIVFGLTIADSIALNQYMDGNNPATDQFLANWYETNEVLEAVVEYSVAVIDVVEETSSQESIEQLIQVIGTLNTRLQKIPVSAKHVEKINVDADALMARMREQKTAMKALSVAGPLIDDYAEVLRSVVGDTQESFDLAFNEIYAKIEARHGTMLSFRANVIDRQNTAIIGFQLLDKATGGDNAAWKELTTQIGMLGAS